MSMVEQITAVVGESFPDGLWYLLSHGGQQEWMPVYSTTYLQPRAGYRICGPFEILRDALDFVETEEKAFLNRKILAAAGNSTLTSALPEAAWLPLEEAARRLGIGLLQAECYALSLAPEDQRPRHIRFTALQTLHDLMRNQSPDEAAAIEEVASLKDRTGLLSDEGHLLFETLWTLSYRHGPYGNRRSGRDRRSGVERRHTGRDSAEPDPAINCRQDTGRRHAGRERRFALDEHFVTLRDDLRLHSLRRSD